jgi:hypothetical protein
MHFYVPLAARFGDGKRSRRGDFGFADNLTKMSQSCPECVRSFVVSLQTQQFNLKQIIEYEHT